MLLQDKKYFWRKAKKEAKLNCPIQNQSLVNEGR
jgi:hypothetical protein